MEGRYPRQIPAAREVWELEDGTILTNVHPHVECEGRNCTIHAPSGHPLRDAELLYGNGHAYRLCEHGVAHPDHDEIEWRKSQGQTLQRPHWCCEHKCCGIPSEPQRAAGTATVTQSDGGEDDGWDDEPM